MVTIDPTPSSRSSDTLLGETGDPCELFPSDDCDNNPLGAIMGKVEVSAPDHSHCHAHPPIYRWNIVSTTPVCGTCQGGRRRGRGGREMGTISLSRSVTILTLPDLRIYPSNIHSHWTIVCHVLIGDATRRLVWSCHCCHGYQCVCVCRRKWQQQCQSMNQVKLPGGCGFREGKV